MSLNLRIQPEAPKNQRLAPRIAVIGVGGAGGNAVKNMIESNLQGVEFIVCNSDAQALEHNPAAVKIQLGEKATQGLGAGSRPDVGRASAEESLEEVMRYLDGVNMVFITAGMGGGTGTGAAPIIAEAARARGILTVGVVTKPFHFEGAHRMRSAEDGLKNMETVVDTLIVIPNQNLFRIANEKTTFSEAFRLADSVLQSGVRGVTDLMVLPGLINLDFNDIRNVMEEMGKAMMGTGEAEGEGRALRAAEAAVNNPLLDDVSMKGAKGVIINITGGEDMSLYEVDEACNYIRDEVDPNANIIFGSTFDTSLQGQMRISIVATGIDQPESKRQGTTTSAASPVSAPVAPRATYAAPEVAAKADPFKFAPPSAAQALQQVNQQPAAPAYSPTIKPAAANYVIPNAPFEAPKAPAAYAMPELPLTGRAAQQEHDLFIAPAAVTADTVEAAPEYKPQASTYEAPPMRAPNRPTSSRMPTMDGDAEPSAPVRKAHSLFEKLKNTILPEGAVTHAPVERQTAAPAPRRAQMATVYQPSLDIESVPQSQPQMAEAEDDLEIPAFLRRQAN